MAATLIIPDFNGKGRPLKENLESASMRDNWHNRNSNSKDVDVSLKLNKDTNRFLEMAVKGTHIEKLKIELSALEKEVVKTYAVYELTNSIISTYQIYGSHSGPVQPTLMLTFNYETMKTTYNYDND